VLVARRDSYRVLTPPDVPNKTYVISETPDNRVWYAGSALSYVVGGEWTRVEQPRILQDTWVDDGMVDGGGALWLGTRSYGLVRFQEDTWTRFDSKSLLPSNTIMDLEELSDGSFLILSDAGVFRFDGVSTVTSPLSSIENMDRRDVLHQMLNGEIVVNAGEDETTRTVVYRPEQHAHESRIVSGVIEVPYGGVNSISWAGMDPWTESTEDALQFSWKLDQAPWGPYSTTTNVTLIDLSPGNHTFSVRSRDKDYNVEDAPATFAFVILPPIWQDPFLVSLLAALAFGILLQTRRVIRRGRELKIARDLLLRELEEEMETAQKLQENLMPSDVPDIEGYAVSGLCIPAARVGGDFFQFYRRTESTLGIALADVTGHAMEAAIPMVMFSGMLQTRMTLDASVQSQMQRLNEDLHKSLPDRTFVCFLMADLDLDTSKVTLSDSGCPYPYHYQAASRRLMEIPIDAYPLGIRPDTLYVEACLSLEPDDRLIFCSDGIMEAMNEEHEQLNYERTYELVETACNEGRTPQEIIQYLFTKVGEFSGGAQQEDDMTCVVLHKLPT
jgi:hypothetical protein